MTISFNSMSIAHILHKLNIMNINTSMSIAHLLVRLNSINIYTSMSIACIIVRLNNINNNIWSQGVYLLTAEEDNVGGDGDIVADSGTKSSMRGGWRAQI